MKIAIATDGTQVSPHFGRCPLFTIVEIAEGKVVEKKVIDNPGHHPGFLPDFLSKEGVSCIIAGGMGGRASGLFAEKGIKAVVGISGKVDDVIESFLKGALREGESLCKPGSGKGYGVEKSECDHSNES